MKRQLNLLFLLIFCLSQGVTPAFSDDPPDFRNVRNGLEIPTETYADQPYIVKTNDGAWLVCLTTGADLEGKPGQHIITMRSTDQGKTWSAPVDVEPADGPEASYAVMLKVPSGRVYIFYNHNSDNLRKVKADDPPYKDGWCYRVDSQGYFVFKYSVDHGKSWSAKRYPISIRNFEIDRENPYAGNVKFFWNVGRPFINEGSAFVPIIKVGGFGKGFFTRNEGAILKSDNILQEANPDKISWETLPEGEIGLRTPEGGGPIAAEQSYSVLSDGSIYVVYRTIDGYPVESYSRDGGRHWEAPQYKKYANGQLMKHPRAANFVWKCENGHFLYWFHNHGGRFIRDNPDIAYNDRNPVWVCGGVEMDGAEGKIIRWTQPEILLYDDDPIIRMSYPDLVEEDGRYFVTETQKSIARVHEIDPSLFEGLWQQFENQSIAQNGLVLSLPDTKGEVPAQIVMPELPWFLTRDNDRADHGTKDLRTGFSVGLWFYLNSLDPNQILLDNRTENGQGFILKTIESAAVELVMNDGRTENRWSSGPGTLQSGALQHLLVIVDGGPDIITFVVNGAVCDGGDYRQFGWGRFSPHLQSVNGASMLKIAPEMKGEIKTVRIYNRALRVSESIGNHQAGL